jgi:hypothetical protein
MTDKALTSPDQTRQLEQALIAWRDVRERIFRHEGLPPPSIWVELGNAELALMTLARDLGGLHDVRLHV